MDRSSLKKQAKENIKIQFSTLVLCLFIQWCLIGLSSYISLLLMIITGPLNVGVAWLYAKNSRQEEIQVRDMAYGFENKFVESFVMGVLKSLFTALWSLLFIIPGIIKSFSYAMASYIMMRESDITGYESIKKSMKMMNGHKWDLFVLKLSFIGWYILAIFTFGIALVWIEPYRNATEILFFENIYENEKKYLE